MLDTDLNLRTPPDPDCRSCAGVGGNTAACKHATGDLSPGRCPCAFCTSVGVCRDCGGWPAG